MEDRIEEEEESNSCSNISFKLIMVALLYFLNNRCNNYIHQFYPFFKRAIRYKNGDNVLLDIKTKWGEELDKNNILQEYPRPQFERDSYMNLNGEWDCTLTLVNNTEAILYEGKIIVPFPIESRLSGIEDITLDPGMMLIYKKVIDLSKLENRGKFLLHFGAVDQTTRLYINDKKVGEFDGGYHPFYFDITDYLKDLSKTEITVKVIDNYGLNGAAIGKQGNPRRGIYYQKIGGIWQTVWIESVPNIYIKDVKITPYYDDHSVGFFMTLEENAEINKDIIGQVKIFDDNQELVGSGKIQPNEDVIISLPKDFKSWSPEEPYLYKVEYTYGKDVVKSYFGMRKFSIEPDANNIMRLFLNNKPYFQNGVLDQGFWSDGIYTPPSDEAMIYDIKTMKDLGFNMLRKHIKIEPKRWYYHCDTLGMLVWQDQPSGGGFPYNKADDAFYYTDDDYELFNRTNEIGRRNFYRDINRTLDNLYNSPCISTWVPFNEGWGQFDSVKIATMVKEIDKTRFVDHVSGYVDHLGPDFRSLHIYFDTIKFEKDEINRPVVLSEYGGYGLKVKDHLGCTEQFSYIMFETEEKLTESIKSLIKDQIYPNMIKGLCAAVYTQLSDVEQEINGFLTYDRKVLKVIASEIKEANDMLKLRYD